MKRWRCLLLLLCAPLVSSCDGDGGWLPGPDELPSPDLRSLPSTVRDALDAERRELGARLRAPVDREALAAAFGELGSSYHAYELHDAALACYAVARRLAPDAFDWHYLPAFIHWFRGDLEEASELLERSFEIDSEYPATRVHLAEVRLDQGRFDAARSLLEEALSEDSVKARSHFDLGRLEMLAERPAAAAAHFEAALRLQPEASAVHHLLALAYRRLDRREAAAAELRRAGRNPVRSTDPRRAALASRARDVGSDLARGSRALVDGRGDEAVQWFRRAVEREPTNPSAHLALGSALAREGDRGAAGALAEAVRLAPESLSARLQLARLLAAQGNGRAAREQFETALHLDPAHTAARLELAQLLEELGEVADAYEQYGGVLASDPQNEPALVGRTLCLIRQGERSQALAELRRLVALYPRSLPLRSNLGAVLLELGELEEGLRVLRTAVELEGEPRVLALAHSNYGWALARRGAIEAAAEQHRAALALDPELTSSRVRLADLLRDQERWQEASRHYRQALDRAPDLAAVRLQLARALLEMAQPAAARQLLAEGVALAPENRDLRAALVQVESVLRR